MPVSSIISAGIGFDGSLNDEKTSVTRAICIWQVVEFHHRKFDDFVQRGIEPRGLDIEQNADLGGLSVACSEFTYEE